MPDEEVAHGDARARISGLAGCGAGNGSTGESKDAVVVQQGLQAVLLQVKLRAGVDGVRAARGAEDIAHAVEVIAGERTADRVPQREEAGNADLRQRRRSLHVDVGAVGGQRLARVADASGEHARVAQPDLVYRSGREGPDIAGVAVLLAVGVVV